MAGAGEGDKARCVDQSNGGHLPPAPTPFLQTQKGGIPLGFEHSHYKVVVDYVTAKTVGYPVAAAWTLSVYHFERFKTQGNTLLAELLFSDVGWCMVIYKCFVGCMVI